MKTTVLVGMTSQMQHGDNQPAPQQANRQHEHHNRTGIHEFSSRCGSAGTVADGILRSGK